MERFNTIFLEAVMFALYVFVCLTLLKPRISKWLHALICGAVILCSCAAVFMLSVSDGQIPELSDGLMIGLTLLPLLAYIPFSVCVYVLSEESLFETAAACSMGILCTLIVKTFKKILCSYLNTGLLSTILVLILAAACGFVVYKFIRRSFYAVKCSENRALVMIPIATVLLMILENLNKTDISSAIMTLILAVSLFAIASRLFVYSAKIANAAETEKRLSESLALQHKNFEQLSQSVDAGRIYRHDMRHHLRIISAMAQQNNSSEIAEYIEKLNESSELGAAERICGNPAVNAVMTEYISRAETLGCQIEHKMIIPEDLPFNLPDVCVIISNALDNALNACRNCPENERHIKVLAEFSENRKLKIIVRNSCAEFPRFTEDGLPIIEKKTDNHGLGLRGVKKTAEKYNGFVQCSRDNDEFVFCTEIFCDTNRETKTAKTIRPSKYSKALPAVLTAIVCAIALPNISPATAQALSDELSINIKTISYGWGDNSFKADFPEFKGKNSEILNKSARDFVDAAKEVFHAQIHRRYEGYVAEDAGYHVYLDNDKYISICFFATLNIGGSGEFSYCVTVDKESGRIIRLSDLFDKNFDYIGRISEEVLLQMEQRVKGGKQYFIPGGIWRDDECFKSITEDQNFYLSPDGRLVIVFDEYTVAPGSEGMPEFIIPASIYAPEV